VLKIVGAGAMYVPDITPARVQVRHAGRHAVSLLSKLLREDS
jgi:hypothetical protein